METRKAKAALSRADGAKGGCAKLLDLLNRGVIDLAGAGVVGHVARDCLQAVGQRPPHPPEVGGCGGGGRSRKGYYSSLSPMERYPRLALGSRGLAPWDRPSGLDSNTMSGLDSNTLCS